MIKKLIVILIIVQLYPFTDSFARAQKLAEYQQQKEFTRNQGSLRTAFQQKGIQLDAIYTGDIFSNLQGGIRRSSEYLDVVDLMLTINLDKLCHWKNATFCIDILGIHGGNPSNHVGDFQGISNIAAPNTWKIYETWFQQNLWTDKLSILMGIYDLNSEFDVIETAGLFINSSYGMGPEFSQSGKNGAPTFPYPDLSLRIKTKLTEQLIVQAAILDGVPGDPENPTGKKYMLKKGDGALFTSEIAFITDNETIKYLPQISKRKQRRRRRIGFRAFRKFFHRSGQKRHRYRTSVIEIPRQNYSKIAIGGWYYTTDFNDFLDCDEAGNLIRHKGSWGIYALGEKVFLSKKDNPAKTLSAFVRLGISDKNTNRVDAYLGSGVVLSGISSKHYHDQIGCALAAVHRSDKFKKAKLKEGENSNNWEVALEFSYRTQINNWFAMQPDVQYIINPGYNPSLKNAIVFGTRLEISF